MGVASRCGCKEVVYIDFLILLIPTPLVSALFLQQHPYLFCSLTVGGHAQRGLL